MIPCSVSQTITTTAGSQPTNVYLLNPHTNDREPTNVYVTNRLEHERVVRRVETLRAEWVVFEVCEAVAAPRTQKVGVALDSERPGPSGTRPAVQDGLLRQRALALAAT